MKSSFPSSNALRRAGVVGTLLAAAWLAACGGGNDDRPSVTQAVPASASANIAGFIGYLQQLVVASADTLEPVDTTGVTPPTDETSEPLAVN